MFSCCFNQPVKSPASLTPQTRVKGSSPQKAPATGSPVKTVSTLLDLPNEITGVIADLVFQAAVEDPTHDVSSLACTPALRSILSEELKANAVLRDIHAARSFPALGKALAGVQEIFPVYRQGCLTAALRLMPKLDRAVEADDLLWSQLCALLPPHALRHDGTNDPRETALLAMVEAFVAMRTDVDGCLGLRNVLGQIGRNATVGPQLASALTRWLMRHLQYPGSDGTDFTRMRDRLWPVTPLALQPRFGRLLDFLEKYHGNSRQSPVERMRKDIEAYEEAKAAGDPDLRWKLRLLCKSWGFSSRRECNALYRSFFQRLTPAQQMDLVNEWRSPLDPSEIAPFVITLIGQMPATTILKTVRSFNLHRVRPEDWPTSADMMRDLVLAAAGTPLQDAVLEAAITHGDLARQELMPFLQSRIAHADPGRQRALTLRLGIRHIGNGEFDPSLVKKRAPMSAEVDKLLNGNEPVDPLAIEALADLNVAWLDASQKSRLIKRVEQLPPAQSAQCLTKLFSKYIGARSKNELPDVQTIVGACWKLPPQYRAGPVAELFDLLVCAFYLRLDPGFLTAVRQLYDALPTTMRPMFNARIAKAMRQTPDETFT